MYLALGLGLLAFTVSNRCDVFGRHTERCNEHLLPKRLLQGHQMLPQIFVGGDRSVERVEAGGEFKPTLLGVDPTFVQLQARCTMGSIASSCSPSAR